jgi:hypothetical protein
MNFLKKYSIIFSLIITSIVVFIIAELLDNKEFFKDKKLEYLKFYLSTFTIYSIILAGLQFRIQFIWQRREKTIAFSKEIDTIRRKPERILKKNLNFDNKLELNIAISIAEIDEVLYQYENEKKVVDKAGNFIMNPLTGQDTKDAIVAILNLCEDLAAGVYNSVFDIEVVKTLYRSYLISVYTIFSEYISHVQKKLSNDNIWKNFSDLSTLLINEKMLQDEKKRTQKRNL